MLIKRFGYARDEKEQSGINLEDIIDWMPAFAGMTVSLLT
jgi:hypothetical protein